MPRAVSPSVCLPAGLLVAGFLAISPARAVGQALTRDTPLPAADLRADLAVLRRAYTELHPGLLRYNSAAEIAARFDEVDRYFTQDRTLGDAFLALTRLTAAVRCGHSYPNFYNQPAAIQAALFEADDRLPFEFRWLDRRMVVTTDRTPDHLLPRGTVIERVDGVPTPTILDSLLPLARADGGNDAKRIAYLGVQGEERWHPFDILYPLVFPRATDSYELQVRRPGEARTATLRVAPRSAAARRDDGAPASTSAPDAPLWRFTVEGGVGILSMPTWVLYNSTWDARAWLDGVLVRVRQEAITDLVIDLRGNEGGSDLGNELLAHFLREPVTRPPVERRVRYRAVPAELNPVLDTWDDAFRDWGEAARGPGEDGFYRLVDDGGGSGERTIRPLDPAFGGRLWVLVDGANSSATFSFALAVQETGVGTLVGEPTGGNRRGINGGAFFFVRLPRTGLEVDLPLVGGFPAEEQPDAGVVPDLVVVPTADQVAAGVDPAMDLVRERIARLRGG